MIICVRSLGLIKIMSETLDYYDKNAEAFVNGTADIEYSEMQDMVLARLPAGATILDFGCGSDFD